MNIFFQFWRVIGSWRNFYEKNNDHSVSFFRRSKKPDFRAIMVAPIKANHIS